MYLEIGFTYLNLSHFSQEPSVGLRAPFYRGIENARSALAPLRRNVPIFQTHTMPRNHFAVRRPSGSGRLYAVRSENARSALVPVGRMFPRSKRTRCFGFSKLHRRALRVRLNGMRERRCEFGLDPTVLIRRRVLSDLLLL